MRIGYEQLQPTQSSYFNTTVVHYSPLSVEYHV
jgi:hypothetical protein